MTLQFENFKKRKMSEVGNRGAFETNRKLDVDFAGLIGGFSDILASQPFYTKTLTVTKDTLVPGISETKTVETVVTRSWNNEWLCTACKPPHHILKTSYFALMVTDHHGLAKVPALDGMCVASCRFEGFTLGQILDHVFHMVVAAWVSGEEPRSSDEHGPVHALHQALKMNKEIHIFISSGTSLILEGPSGYSYQMQRGLDLMACKSFGTGTNNLFRRVVYIQPTINNTVRPTNNMTMRHLMAHITVEAANCGRLLCINSSSTDYTLRTFISSTESVKVEESQD